MNPGVVGEQWLLVASDDLDVTIRKAIGGIGTARRGAGDDHRADVVLSLRPGDDALDQVGVGVGHGLFLLSTRRSLLAGPTPAPLSF